MGVNRREFLAGSAAVVGLLAAGISIPQAQRGDAESAFWQAFYANVYDTTLLDLRDMRLIRISKSGARRIENIKHAGMCFGEERYGLYRGRPEIHGNFCGQACGKQCAEFISHKGSWSLPKFVTYRDWESSGYIYGWHSMSVEELQVEYALRMRQWT